MPNHSQAPEVIAAIASPSGLVWEGALCHGTDDGRQSCPPTPQRFCMCKAWGACG